MSETEISETGVWYDLQEHLVVTEAPRKGVQLVPPGGEVTKERQERIDRYLAATGQDQSPEQPTEDDAPAPKPRARKAPAKG